MLFKEDLTMDEKKNTLGIELGADEKASDETADELSNGRGEDDE